MTVAVYTLGCKVNIYESEFVISLLKKNNYEIVDFNEKADIYIINTCSVTNESDKKNRKIINEAKRKNSDAIIVVMGCYSQVNPDLIDADIVLGNKDKSKIIELLDECIKKKEKIKKIYDIRKTDFETMSIDKFENHTRAFVKIQEGCNAFCSYCIIPYARGRVRSRKLEDVEREARRLAENGFQELVLTGIHLSSYGIDCDSSLLELIRTLHGIDGIERIRLGSLEPGIITESFVQALVKLPKVCPHFHLSLQSGSATVLRRMNRRYTPEEYLEKCELLRQYYEHPAITTDVIVGFPGETSEEFAETCAFVKKVDFYEVHVFKYSKRNGTVAASMPDQIPESLKAERSSILMELAERQKREFIQYYEGKEVSVLFEEPVEVDGVRYFEGLTPEYVKVWVPTEENLTNRIMKVEFFPYLY